MTNGFGKLLFQNHNGSMRITGSPFIRSFIRVFITGKLAPTCTQQHLHCIISRYQELKSLLCFIMKLYISVFLSNNLFVKGTYMRYAQLSLNVLLYFLLSILRAWCVLPFFVNNIYFQVEESDIFSYRGFWSLIWWKMK